MNKKQSQLHKQLQLLQKDLERCDKRCQKISKVVGIENNHLFDYALEQTKLILEYIESLKEEEND